MTALGWPWDALAEAQAKLLEAQQFAALALEAGEETDRAHFDLTLALERQERARGEMADILLLMLRCLLDARPGCLSKLVEQLFADAGYPGLLQRIGDLEMAVADLEVARVERT